MGESSAENAPQLSCCAQEQSTDEDNGGYDRHGPEEAQRSADGAEGDAHGQPAQPAYEIGERQSDQDEAHNPCSRNHHPLLLNSCSISVPEEFIVCICTYAEKREMLQEQPEAAGKGTGPAGRGSVRSEAQEKGTDFWNSENQSPFPVKDRKQRAILQAGESHDAIRKRT